MKKFLVLAVVLVALCISSVAFAIDVTVNGEAAFRSRLFENIGQQANSHGDASNDAYTEVRYDVAINIKGDGARAVLEVWNDFDKIGGGSKPVGGGAGVGRGANDGNTPATGANRGVDGTNSSVFIRQAFVEFTVPGTPVTFLGGRWLSMMGEGWFLRSNYGGQEGFLVTIPIGKVASIAFQDVKIGEGNISAGSTAALTTKSRDDVDLYSIIATVKPTDKFTLNANVSYLNDKTGTVLLAPGVTALNQAATPQAEGHLWNLGLSWNGKIGVATLKGEIDVQSGMVQRTGSVGSADYDGYQGIVQLSVPVGIVTVNAGAAYGSGNRPGSSNKSQVVTLLDVGQHYALVYEYRTVAGSKAANTGLANTAFVSAGVMVQATKSVQIGFDAYWLQTTEYATDANNRSQSLSGCGNNSKDIGIEADLKLNWQITPNVSWNWQAGWLMAGPAFRTQDAATNGVYRGGYMDDMYAIQGVLSYKF